jgi:hypothetical protein
VPPVVDERFTNQAGRQSYFAPCAVFSHALTGYRIAASGGAVTTVTEGVEVVCVR